MPIEWGEPPATRMPGKPPPEWVAMLKKRPGEWAKIASFNTQGSAGGLAQRIRDGKYGEGFDAVSRKLGSNEWGVWAVWQH